ncbi:MAG: hypothetical protein Q9N68_07450 [Gammaproteobacteria bacterium]|nr:hypothetical protein [Gammaproteobacteria bacterium]
MDEPEFKKAYHALSYRPCPFEKTQLARHSQCRHAQQFRIADRSGLSCQSATAQPRCQQLLNLLRHNARFTLQLSQIEGPLPHSKEIKVQTGGLRGLRNVLQGEKSEGIIEDIFTLLEQAITQFQELDNLPYEQFLTEINAVETRWRRRKRSNPKPDGDLPES